MPLSINATLGAGCALQYEDPVAPGIFVDLPNALNVGGQMGSQGEFVETTPISKTTREYIAGMKTPPDKQFGFNHTPGVPAYARFLQIVDNSATYGNIRMRVNYTTGERATIWIALSGRVMDEAEGNAQLKHQVFGKQSGDPIWENI
jgi:Phage tail tube protein family